MDPWHFLGQNKPKDYVIWTSSNCVAKFQESIGINFTRLQQKISLVCDSFRMPI